MSWSLFIFCFAYYVIAGIALVIGYHRGLSHQSFQLKKWFLHLIVVLALPAGTPIQWVGNHRFHHAHTDEELDPHSPVVKGFWFAHCGWYINTKNPFLCFLYSISGPIRLLIDAYNRPITNQQHNHLAKDILQDNFLRKISKPNWFRFILVLHFLLPILLTYTIWGWGGIVSWSITLVVIYNIGDSIDSFAHLIGEKTGKGNARNNSLLAILTFGDGWHSNHHKHPSKAKTGVKKRQIDISWYIILLLEKMGIAYKVKKPTKI